MAAISQAFERIPHTAVDTPSTRVRIPSLDGLRGIAILMVILGHTAGSLSRGSPSAEPRWTEIGLYGVTVFFVISGYLITSRLKAESERTGAISLRAFYVRRFFRLMPAAWIYLAAIWSFSPKGFIRPGEIAAAVFCFRNYYTPGHSLSGHFWSLSVEEQFYLVWPAVLAVAWFSRARSIALTGAVAAFAWKAVYGGAAGSGIQYHADALLAGCFVGIAGVPRWRFLEAVARPLSWKPLVWVGTISYSLYLWQQPFTLAADTWPTAAVGMVLLFGFASASFYFVERPLIAMSYRYRASSDSSRKALSTSPAR